MHHSPFDAEVQNHRLESRIVVALERISEAFRVLLWEEAKTLGLSPIQIQILIFIHYHAGDKCKVGYLADEFNMTKATISDSVKVLTEKNLIKKETDPNDTRSFVLSLTSQGETIAKRASFFATTMEKPMENWSQNQKSNMLMGLLSMISDLNKQGIITVQRMCFSCRFYKKENGIHYCGMLNTTLKDGDLRLDCPEYAGVEVSRC